MYSKQNFYLTAYTADGVNSFTDGIFKPFSDDRLFIAAGASEALRSDFIKGVAKIIRKEGFPCETIRSNIDEAKITGAVFDEINVCLFDASAVKKQLGNVSDCTDYIVNLGEICNRTELYERREEIFSVKSDIEKHLQRCKKFLSAGVSMREDIQRIVGKSLSAEKLEKFVTRFVKKEFGETADKAGKLSVKYIDSLSPFGVKTEYETVRNTCARIYVLDDCFGIVSDALITQIKDAALMCGYDVIICPDLIEPKKSKHIIIPQLSLCFFTSDALCPWDGEYTKKINFTRFTDRETVKSHKNRIKFNNDAVEDLVSQACVNLEVAKCGVDRLDDIYESCCAREKLDGYIEKTADEIMSCLRSKGNDSL